MAALENRRHECFAQLLAAMKPPAEAYLMAGYAKGSSYKDNARRLENHPAIKARISELQSEVAGRLVELSAEWIRQRVARIAGADVPLDDVRPSDVIAAARLLAQMIPGAMAPEEHKLTGDVFRSLKPEDQRALADLAEAIASSVGIPDEPENNG